MIALEREETAGANPVVDHGARELAGENVEEARPKTIQHRLRPHLHTWLSTGVDSLERLRGANARPNRATEHEH
jgi:hypothetical protein